MAGRTRVHGAAILTLFLMILATVPNSPLIQTADAEVTCCDSTELDYVLLGDAAEDGEGRLSPFVADLGDEYEVAITTSIHQLTEVARWRLMGTTPGDYPAGTWQLSVPYVVENANGIQANATAEVKIGGRSWTGSTWSNPAYTPGEGVIEIDVDIEAGNIVSSGELVEVVFSVQTLLFNTPSEDAGVKFIWGSDDYRGFLRGNLPLFNMDWQPAAVDGRSVSFPVVLESGQGHAIWDKSDVELKVDGQTISTVVATMHQEGAQVFLNWQAPESAVDGVYEVNLSLRVDPARAPVTGGYSYALVFGEGSGSGLGIFPPEEPLRSGGSGLSVHIEADVERGDRLKRTTTIEFDGPMAAWFRWGLDNIGNDSLDTLSQWRDVQSTSASDADMNNHQVDNSEIQALETHLSGRASSLNRFLFDGMMLEPDRLLGIEPIEAAAAPSVRIDVEGERGFSSSKISMKIVSLEIISVGERSVLFDNFLRPQPSATPIWSKVTIEAKFTTSAMVGTADVKGSGIDYSHNRLVFAERLVVPAQTLAGEDELSDFSIIYAFGGLAHAPLSSLVTSLLVVTVLSLLGMSMTKNKARTGVWLTLPLLVIIWLYAYLFALPLPFLLGAVGAVGLLMVAVAIVTPRPSDMETVADETAYVTIVPARGRRRRTKVPIINCPACNERNPVVGDERPLRIPCRGCGARLKIS